MWILIQQKQYVIIIIFIKQNRCYCFVFSKQFSNKFFNDEKKTTTTTRDACKRQNRCTQTHSQYCYFAFVPLCITFARAHMFLYHIQSVTFVLYSFSVERCLFFCHSHYGRVKNWMFWFNEFEVKSRKRTFYSQCVYYFYANSESNYGKIFSNVRILC